MDMLVFKNVWKQNERTNTPEGAENDEDMLHVKGNLVSKRRAKSIADPMRMSAI